MAADNISMIVKCRHPDYLLRMADWEKWRLSYEGGEIFRGRYLERFTHREDEKDFESRRKMTPIPGFAKTAINDIRNSIFQRMGDVVRSGGSDSYQKAIRGLDLGVDRRGSNMNAFLGRKILTDLLCMGQVGVFVDAPVLTGPATLADVGDSRPYLYAYSVEDILSWACTRPEAPSEFQAVLLRDSVLNYDQTTGLPTHTGARHRLMWIDPGTRRVNLQFYDADGNPTDRDGNPGGSQELELTRIPFVLIDIGDSLIKDVCAHQIALLNLGSSDVNYALKANFPFYVEQRDMRAVGSHLKVAASAEGTATAGGQGASDTDIRVGTAQGRAYDIKANPPAFIHPSPEPLQASLQLQAKLEQDIRKLVNLAVVNLATRASAESKSMDNQGLEAGLSYIGLVLESAERQIAEHWAAYEERTPSNRQVATIKYPDRYNLKTDNDRIEEATKLSKLMFAVPGRTVKREIAKCVVQTLLGGKVSVDTVETISQEIDASPYTTSDAKTIIDAKNAGLVGDKNASVALGFPDDEYLRAREDHIDRAMRIAQAQASVDQRPSPSDPAARGVDDLSADPANAGADEKAASRDNTMRDSTASRVRGEGAATGPGD
jgi:hypothetical protein